MRGVERWGVTDMLKRAFTGFKALPESNSKDWWNVLNVEKYASKFSIKVAFRLLAKKYHPDNPNTGNEALFKELKTAYDDAIAGEELK